MQGPIPQNPSSAPGAVAAITHARFPGLARRLPWLVLALLAAFPLLAPALGLEYYVGFVRRVLIVAIAASSLNFILGYGGMAALGHAGFMSVGGYSCAIFIMRMMDVVGVTARDFATGMGDTPTAPAAGPATPNPAAGPAAPAGAAAAATAAVSPAAAPAAPAASAAPAEPPRPAASQDDPKA